MRDVGVVLVAGGALAAPWLLDQAAAAGFAVIPPYVTAGAREAVGPLAGEILGAQPRPLSAAQTRALVQYRTNYHLKRVLDHLRAIRGVSSSKNFALITPEDGVELCRVFLAACRAGCASSTEPYRVVKYLAPPLTPSTQYVAFDRLADGGSFRDEDLTDLGRAVIVVVKQKLVASIGSSELFRADDLQSSVARLTAEMDSEGVSVLGDPERYETIGPLEALGQSLDWVQEQAGKGAGALVGAVGEGLAGLVLSTTGLLLVGGLLVWRVSR